MRAYDRADDCFTHQRHNRTIIIREVFRPDRNTLDRSLNVRAEDVLDGINQAQRDNLALKRDRNDFVASDSIANAREYVLLGPFTKVKAEKFGGALNGERIAFDKRCRPMLAQFPRLWSSAADEVLS